MVAKFHLGGLILVGFTADDPTGATNPTTNVDSPQQVRKLTAGLQQAAAPAARRRAAADRHRPGVRRGHPGHGRRDRAALRDGVRRRAASRRSPRRPGTRPASELAAMGINVDFAPVADTLGAAGNAVIGSRSFGADPAANAAQVAAAVRGPAGGRRGGRRSSTSRATGTPPATATTTAGGRAEQGAVDRAGPAAVPRPASRPAPGVVMSGHLDVQGARQGRAGHVLAQGDDRPAAQRAEVHRRRRHRRDEHGRRPRSGRPARPRSGR